MDPDTGERVGGAATWGPGIGFSASKTSTESHTIGDLKASIEIAIQDFSEALGSLMDGLSQGFWSGSNL